MSTNPPQDAPAPDQPRTNGHSPAAAAELAALPTPASAALAPPTAPPPDDNRIDLRTAGIDLLRRLPGVGPVLAQRILDQRDRMGGFTQTEDLKTVSGIGPAVYEHLAPRITVSAPEPAAPAPVAAPELAPAAEPPPVADSPAEPPPATPPSMPEPAPQPVAASAPSPLPPAPQPAPARSSRDWAGLILSSVAGAIVGAVFTLIVLALINRGTLDLNRRAELEALSGRADTLSSQLEDISGEVAAVQGRADELQAGLDSLSGLPRRVEAVEDSAAETASQLRETEGRVATLEDRTDTLAGQVEAILGAVGRFNRFLDGLRDLLLNTEIVPAQPTAQPTAPAPTAVPATAQPTLAPTRAAPTQTPRPPTRTPAATVTG